MSERYGIREANFYMRGREPYMHVRYFCRKTKAAKTYDGPLNTIREGLGSEVNTFISNRVEEIEKLGGD